MLVRMPIVPQVVTAPATVAQVDLPVPSSVRRAVIDHLVIAPATDEPLFLRVWAGTGRLSTDPVFDIVPIKDGANVVPLGYHLPQGATVRLSTAAAGTGNPAAAKVISFRWEQ